MRIAHRAGVLALSLSLAGALSPTTPASARSDEIEARERPSRATAATRGLELDVFGSRATIGSSSAEISDRDGARARAAGVDDVGRTVVSTKVGGDNKRQAANACLPGLALFDLVEVHQACGEARVQTLPPLFTENYPVHTGAALLPPQRRAPAGDGHAVDNGGPQALGRGSVARVELRGGDLLGPEITRLRALAGLVSAVPGQTLAATTAHADQGSRGAVETLAAGLGVHAGDPVTPVATLIDQLLGAVERATRLVSIRLEPSLAQANTDARSVVSLAHAGGGEIQLLPGVAPGDAPLLSVSVTGARSTSTFDRETARPAPAFEPAAATIRLGLPLAGGALTELPVRPGSPVTLLAGTPLETTVSVGGGRNVTDEDGSVESVGEGVRVRMLSGVKGGIDLRMGGAESAVGGPAGAIGGGLRGPWPVVAGLALGASVLLLLLALATRARAVGTTPPTRAHAGVAAPPSSA